MVCWEVNIMDVAFKVKSIPFLTLALERLKIDYAWRVENEILDVGGIRINLKEQTATYESWRSDLMNQIRREYSAVIIEKVAKKKKWALRKASERKMKLKKF